MAKRDVKGVGEEGGSLGWEGEGCWERSVGWGLFLGRVRQYGVSRGQVCCLGYQHPDTEAKTAQTGETIRRKEEGERWRYLQCGPRCFTATVAPWRDEDTAKRERKGG